MNRSHSLVKHSNALLKSSLLPLLATLLGASTNWAANVSTAGNGDWNSTTPNAPWPGGTVPSSMDDVTIQSTHSITVSGTPASSVNSITVSGGSGTQLTINSGATLNVTSGFTHNSPGSGFITSVVAVNGSLNVGGAYVSNGYGTAHVKLLLGAGASCAISGTYTTYSTSVTDMSSGGTLNLGGSPAWSGSSDTFTAGSGTVVYNRSGNQTVLTTASYYFNLTLSGSGTKTLAGNTAVYGTLSIQGTATLAPAGHAFIYGSSANLEYKGTAAQATSTAEFPATMPAAVIINNPSGVTLDAAKTAVNRNLTVASGALFNNGAYAITMGSGCNFSVNSGATFNLTGTSGMVAVSGGGTKTFDPASTVNYAGTTQTVSADTYGNLTIGAGTKTFASRVTAVGTLALDPAAVVSLASGGSYTANTLKIGGVSRGAGTWGNTGSGATHIDPAHFAGTGVLNVTAGPGTSTALASSPNPSTYGSPVTFTANVTGSGPMPTGTVTFKEGSSTLGAGTLDGSGVATLVISTLLVAASPHSITAVYGGDNNYPGSTSSAVVQVVNKANPSVAAWPSATDIPYGKTLADSTLIGGSATPGGAFAFTAPSTVPNAGTAAQSVTFTPTDTANYKNASGTVMLRVLPQLSGSLASLSLSGYKGTAIKVVFVAKDSYGKGLATNAVELATADGGSSFSYAMAVPPETATLSLKPRFYLRRKFAVPASIATGNQVTLDITGTFLGGDADDNNQVDGNDYAWIRALWGKTSNTQYDVNGDEKIDADDFPDLNGDGVLDAKDYALLKDGWYHRGDDE